MEPTVSPILTVISFVASMSAWGHPDLDRQQVMCVAENIYHEARGEDTLGQIATANVVMNRVAHPAYPSTACRVIHQRHQFSWTIKRRRHLIRDGPAWTKAVETAALVYSGLINDQTHGATHYYNPSKVKPSWRLAFQFIGDIGNHRFHRRKS